MLDTLITMLDASAIYILAGFLLAGVLHVVLDRRKSLLDPLRGKGPRPVMLSALIGIPLPLCSCSVLPTAMSLRRSGAGKGATASFLITVPETDIVSIMLTYGLLGPVMAIARPLASLITGIASGLAVDAVPEEKAPPATGLEMADPPAKSCCCAPAGTAAPAPELSGWQHARGWLYEVRHFGFVKFFDDIILLLIGGLALSAVIGGLFPHIDITLLTGNPLLSYLLMLAVGIPMYICATASTPIAAALIAAGVSPGAALILLLAGPATNSAGLLVVKKEFGNRIFGVYLGTIIGFSLLMGLLLDLAISHLGLPSPTALIGDHIHAEAGARWATWLFGLLTVMALWRKLRARLQTSKESG